MGIQLRASWPAFKMDLVVRHRPDELSCLCSVLEAAFIETCRHIALCLLFIDERGSSIRGYSFGQGPNEISERRRQRCPGPCTRHNFSLFFFSLLRYQENMFSSCLNKLRHKGRFNQSRKWRSRLVRIFSKTLDL